LSCLRFDLSVLYVDKSLGFSRVRTECNFSLVKYQFTKKNTNKTSRLPNKTAPAFYSLKSFVIAGPQTGTTVDVGGTAATNDGIT
jgi:hypothetical protein